MRLRVCALSGVGSDRHPALAGAGTAVALVAEPSGRGAVRVLVSFQAPAAVALSLRSLREAVALTVEVPELGLSSSALLVDLPPPGAPRRPNRVNPPEPPPGHLMSGEATAEVLLDPPPHEPVTLFLRAVFRDALSAPCRVELGPKRPQVPA